MLPKIETHEDRRLADRQSFGRTLGANEPPLVIEDKRRQPWLTLFYGLMFLLIGASLMAYQYVPAYER